ncbi:DUF5683 domain-containing protein [Rubrivirga sp.]|uniref:DUF5683 domain-containing protein n=1 Tax=Rubrivirga sp. TaxID=1885344 RepID=UPI003B51893C
MRSFCAAALVALLGTADAQPADSLARLAAPVALDTVAVDTSAARTPRGAVVRSLLVPGLGQVYNRQPLKAPVAAGLVVGAVVYFVDRQAQYVLYRRATAYAGCRTALGGNPDTVPDGAEVCENALASYQDEYDRLNAQTATDLSFQTLRSVRATARGQRDVGGVVVLVAYALQALDAYVAAELADFDVSEDLGVRVVPGPAPSLALRVRL